MSCAEIRTAIRCSRAMRCEQRDDLLLASDVEVREWLVEQQQLAAADERVGDQHPLLLAAGEVADARVREARRVDRLEHLVDECAAPREGSGMPRRCPSSPSPTTSRARSGMSGSSSTFCGT